MMNLLRLSPLLVVLTVLRDVMAFQAAIKTASPVSPLFMSATDNKKKIKVKKPYEPKWKKLATLEEQLIQQNGAPIDPAMKGIKGDISVIFKQGNATKTTLAFAGQPLRDVATQAGQFIKYGCGKGECGTCECLVNGQWIRPCSTTVPAIQKGEDYVVQVKEQKAVKVSSGKFFTAKSFVLGFWNNLLGMFGVVRDRRDARKNWEERREFEELLRQKTLEKKRLRALQQQQNKDLSP